VSVASPADSADTGPVRTAPVDTAPVDTAPVDTAPVDTVGLAGGSQPTPVHASDDEPTQNVSLDGGRP
jgi:ribonuclease E